MSNTSNTNEILTAIAKAMGQVQKVGKDGRNKHDGYNFASIDDFLALVNPICAENGIIVMMQETTIEDFTRKGKFGENSWMRVTWEIVVGHVSGQTLPPVSRTVEVLRNGAQAYGSSQSYALKQFLRSLFLIPTGDKDDADLQPTDAGIVSQGRQQLRPEPDNSDAVEKATAYLNEADTLADLADRWGKLPKEVQRIPAVISAKDARKAELTPKESVPSAANEIDDEIPHQ